MFYKIINLIKINLILKNKIIRVKLYKNDFVIINIFIKMNIIKSVKKIKNFYLINLNLSSMFENIINLYKPSQIKIISLKELKKINKKRSNIFYISTNKGLINNFEAEKKKTGGILVMKIFL